jgi:hypothetical protein
MKPDAISQANERLEWAQTAVDDLAAATTFAQTRKAWSHFLTAVSQIYSKLEQGSKGNGSSDGWFGRIKHERKTDDLLSYLHHARDGSEHGLALVLKESQRTILDYQVGPTSAYAVTITFEGSENSEPVSNIKHTNLDTGEVYEPLKTKLEKILVVSTIRDDRYGTTFYPPKNHLGKDIESSSPRKLAELAMPYIRDLVAVATTYVVP